MGKYRAVTEDDAGKKHIHELSASTVEEAVAQTKAFAKRNPAVLECGDQVIAEIEPGDASFMIGEHVVIERDGDKSN